MRCHTRQVIRHNLLPPHRAVLLKMEEEWIQKTCEQIAAFKPDLVITGKACRFLLGAVCWHIRCHACWAAPSAGSAAAVRHHAHLPVSKRPSQSEPPNLLPVPNITLQSRACPTRHPTASIQKQQPGMPLPCPRSQHQPPKPCDALQRRACPTWQLTTS